MNIYIESLLNGLMAYWDEEKDAARYYVHLLIGDKHLTRDVINGRQTLVEGEETFKEIALIEQERNIRYFSFNNLGKIDQKHPDERMRHGLCGYSKDYSTGKNYYIYVEAEDKNGKIISKSNKEKGSVFVLENGFYSLFY